MDLLVESEKDLLKNSMSSQIILSTNQKNISQKEFDFSILALFLISCPDDYLYDLNRGACVLCSESSLINSTNSLLEWKFPHQDYQ